MFTEYITMHEDSNRRDLKHESEKRGKKQDDPEEGELDDPQKNEKQESKDSRKIKFNIKKFFAGRSRKDKTKSETDNELNRDKSPVSVRDKLLKLGKQLSADNIRKILESGSKDGKTNAEEIKPPRVYISSGMAAMLIISVTTGSALSDITFHLRESGWFGIFLILLLGLNSLGAGLCTGWCWATMEEEWPEYFEYSRVPYQDIAYRAVGKWMKYIVAILVDIQVLGTCANYIVIISDAIHQEVHRHIFYCSLIIIVAVILAPFSLFGSYTDIKFIGNFDVILSLLFTLLTIVSLFFDKNVHGSSVYKENRKTLALGFAGMSYAYGVGPILPSILVEMKDRRKFTESCVTAYMVILAIYTVFTTIGYAAYGNQTPGFILEFVILNPDLTTFGEVIHFIQAFQLATTFVLCMIPSLHAFEVRFNCPDGNRPGKKVLCLQKLL